MIEQKICISLRGKFLPGITEPITFILSGDTFEYKENVKNFDNTLSAILIFRSRPYDSCISASKIWVVPLIKLKMHYSK